MILIRKIGDFISVSHLIMNENLQNITLQKPTLPTLPFRLSAPQLVFCYVGTT